MAFPVKKIKNTAWQDAVDAYNYTPTWERLRVADIGNAFNPMRLGGNLVNGIAGAGVQDIDQQAEIELDLSQEVGTGDYVFKVKVVGYVENAGISVIPEIWEYTTIGSPTLVTAGSAISATTPTRQTFTLAAHPAGTRYYRLRANKSAGTYLAFLMGSLERSMP